jgi:hypothetical protein
MQKMLRININPFPTSQVLPHQSVLFTINRELEGYSGEMKATIKAYNENSLGVQTPTHPVPSYTATPVSPMFCVLAFGFPPLHLLLDLHTEQSGTVILFECLFMLRIIVL